MQLDNINNDFSSLKLKIGVSIGIMFKPLKTSELHTLKLLLICPLFSCLLFYFLPYLWHYLKPIFIKQIDR